VEHGLLVILKRLKPILIPYAIATAMYQLVESRHLDFDTYISQLTRFSANRSFYFVAFYIQLVIISPLLFEWLCFINKSRFKYQFHGATIIILTVLASVLINYTSVMGLHGGGGIVFGGTYLILYWLGMVFASRRKNVMQMTNKKTGWLVIIMAAVLIVYYLLYSNYYLVLDAKLSNLFKEGFNPPGISFSIYAILVGLFIYFAVAWFEHMGGAINTIIRFIVKLGNCSLYIFLYHRMVLYLMNYIPLVNNMWYRRLIVFPCMILLPCLLKYLVDRLSAVYMTKVRRNPS
jgi:hypothetical protein